MKDYLIPAKTLGQKTNFSIAAAFNPNVSQIDKAVKRLEKKIDCGADYFITQPVYSEDKLIRVYEETKHLSNADIYRSHAVNKSKNAEFLHHEVPGIKISEYIRERMACNGK